MKSEAYREGEQAYADGKSVEANPYPANSKPRVDWDQGWRRSRQHYQDGLTKGV